MDNYDWEKIVDAICIIITLAQFGLLLGVTIKVLQVL